MHISYNSDLNDHRKRSYVRKSILKKLPAEDRKDLDDERKGGGSKRVVRFIVSAV